MQIHLKLLIVFYIICFIFSTPNSLYIFNATVFPILHDDHWSVFVVAILDGYFVFLDSFFEEDHQYQKDVRDLVVSFFNSPIKKL